MKSCFISWVVSIRWEKFLLLKRRFHFLETNAVEPLIFFPKKFTCFTLRSSKALQPF
jgi:hypothetical protein